jgi:hypothetical protein
MLNKAIMFSSLSLILGSFPHSAYSMDQPEPGIPVKSFVPQAPEIPAIDRSPKSTASIVRYTTRALGSLLNQTFQLLGDKDEIFLHFRENTVAIINGTLESPFDFYVNGSAHHCFLEVEDLSLKGDVALASTEFNFMDLANALLRMDVLLENIKDL